MDYKKSAKDASELIQKLLVKRVRAEGLLPNKASMDAAGYDLFSADIAIVPARGQALIKTGISIALPAETYGRIGKSALL